MEDRPPKSHGWILPTQDDISLVNIKKKEKLGTKCFDLGRECRVQNDDLQLAGEYQVHPSVGRLVDCKTTIALDKVACENSRLTSDDS